MRVIYLKRKIKAVYDDICPGIWDLFYDENTLVGTLRMDEEVPAKDLQEEVTFLLTWQEKRGTFPPNEKRIG
jgi:hypothetical protein